MRAASKFIVDRFPKAVCGHGWFCFQLLTNAARLAQQLANGKLINSPLTFLLTPHENVRYNEFWFCGQTCECFILRSHFSTELQSRRPPWRKPSFRAIDFKHARGAMCSLEFIHSVAFCTGCGDRFSWASKSLSIVRYASRSRKSVANTSGAIMSIRSFCFRGQLVDMLSESLASGQTAWVPLVNHPLG